MSWWRLKRWGSEPRICIRENQNKVKEPLLKLLYLYRWKNFRELDPRSSVTDVAIEIFYENSCTIFDRRTIPLNIVLWINFSTQNSKLFHQRNFGKVRHAKQIKSIQVYDKWYQTYKTKYCLILPPWIRSLAMV